VPELFKGCLGQRLAFLAPITSLYQRLRWELWMLRFFVALIMTLAWTPAGTTEAGWALLRNGGQVVLLVHANAPGTGDPANFDIENCRTQRNLSDRGRQQARRIGALFAARAAPVEAVLTSRYCRTRETATLAFGEVLVEEFEALDPPSRDEEEAGLQLDEVVARAIDYTGSGTLVMVTHIENVLQWVGTRPREGEAIIVNAGEEGLSVAARIVFN
jgi:phosphohistidine phosphatase SixA